MRIFGRDPARDCPTSGYHVRDFGSRKLGKGAARLSRARLEMPSRGPMVRASAPPAADAQSIGSKPNTPKMRAAAPSPAAGARDRSEPTSPLPILPRNGGGLGSAALPHAVRGAFLRSVHATPRPAMRARGLDSDGVRDMRSSAGCDNWPDQLIERSAIVPADFDVEHLDAAPACRRHRTMSFAVVTRRACARSASRSSWSSLGSAERVMVRESPSADEFGAERPQRRKEFLRPADPGKGQQTRAGEPLARRSAPAPHAAPEVPPISSGARQPGTAHRRRAARSRRRGQGPRARLSRNGPAGITRPLPKP